MRHYRVCDIINVGGHFLLVVLREEGGGWVEVYFGLVGLGKHYLRVSEGGWGWVGIFYGWVGMGGGIFLVGGVEWIFFMGG